MSKLLRPLNHIDGIYAVTKPMKKKGKGDLFETFTYHLIIYDPRLNNGLTKIWMYNDIPKDILTKLKLPSKDKGIDLLAVINGKYYAIQCKFRQDPNEIIPWSCLSTFFGLSFGMTDGIAGGFFVTNTRNLCQEVIKSDKVVPIYDDFFDSLTSNFFGNIGNDNVVYERKRMNTPQIECVTAARVHFLDNKRGYIEMACGTGKTLASYWIADSMSLGRTVIFVPSLQLLSQFYSDWVNQSYAEGKKLKYLLIGSDADVEDEITEKSNGLILHLDPEEIRKHLSEHVVVICTYQSADKLAEACGKKIKFDFGIFDEAHKTVGQKGKLFSRMLTDDELIINKRLFMTATPKIYIGDNDGIMSMDDKDVYGECFFTYNTGKAIEAGLLTDYQILSMLTKNEAIKRDIKKNNLVTLQREFTDKSARQFAIILVLLKKIADGTIKKLLTYHSTVANAEKFAEFLIKVNELVYGHDIYIASIDGKDSMRTRKNTINEFKSSEIGILCSSRVLNEGVNIVSVDSVCFVDSREGTIDIVQCVGRSLRLCDQKKLAYVIVPIFIDDINDDFDKDEYCTVIKILKAMKSTDSGIIEYFQSKDHRTVTGRQIIRKEYCDLVDVSKDIDIKEWNREIDSELFKIVDSWCYKCGRVEQFVEQNGRFPSQCSTDDATEKKLGTWGNTQRQAKKNGTLSSEQIERLDRIPGWYWDNFDVWHANFLAVQAFYKKTGKFPSKSSKNIEEKRLGLWCYNQRESKKNGKLAQRYIDLLMTLDGWRLGTNRTRSFEDMLDALRQWIDANDRFPKRASVDQNENKLAVWSWRQRLKKTKGRLTKNQINRLESIRFWTWSLTGNKWNKMYDAVKKYIGKNNSLPARKTIDNYGNGIGVWCANQRQLYKTGKLTADRIKRLSCLKGWWWQKLSTTGSKTANPKKRK